MTNPLEQFDKEFVKITSPSTIGSSRSEMVEPMAILNVRKPDKIKAFITTHFISKQALQEAVEKIKTNHPEHMDESLDDLLKELNI